MTKSTWVPAFAGMTRQGTAFAGDYSLRIRARRAQSRSIAPYATQAILLSQIQPQAVIRPNCCVDARRADQRAEATDYCRGVPVDSRLRTRRRRGARRDGSWSCVRSIAYCDTDPAAQCCAIAPCWTLAHLDAAGLGAVHFIALRALVIARSEATKQSRISAPWKTRSRRRTKHSSQ